MHLVLVVVVKRLIYIMNMSTISHRKLNLQIGCEDFIFHLRDNYSVLLTAGKWHGLEGYIRFGYGTPTDYVMGGLERIAQYLKVFSE